MRLFTIAVVISAIAFSSGVFAADGSDLNEIKLQRLVRSYVTDQLKDPDSAQFRNQYGLCGEVNAKNGFGGYTGYVRFMAGAKDKVFMEDDPRLEAGAFDEVWNSLCKTSPSGAKRR